MSQAIDFLLMKYKSVKNYTESYFWAILWAKY